MTELEILRKREELWVRYRQDLLFYYKDKLYDADSILGDAFPIVLTVFREPIALDGAEEKELQNLAYQVKRHALELYRMAYV